MRQLVLLRHAKSSWKDHTLADYDRPLNKRGKSDAPVMGERLAARGIEPSLIISSPARRARRTAEAVADALDYPAEEIEFEEDIYEAGVHTLLHLVRCLDDADREVLLVGHNPGLTELNNLLTGDYIANNPTCGAVVIGFDLPSWNQASPNSGEQKRFDYPKRLEG